MLAEPFGEESPGIGGDGPIVIEPLPAVAPRGPVRRVADGHHPLGVAPDDPRPDPAGRVHPGRVEHPGKQEPRFDRLDVDGVDPPLPAKEGEYRLADEPVVGGGQVAAIAEFPSDRPVSATTVSQNGPLDRDRHVDRRPGQLVDRHDVRDHPRRRGVGTTRTRRSVELRRVGLAGASDDGPRGVQGSHVTRFVARSGRRFGTKRIRGGTAGAWRF